MPKLIKYSIFFYCAFLLSLYPQMGNVLAAEGQIPDLATIQKAAEQGDPKAQHILAFMFSIGQGVPQDDVKAAYWNIKSAEQGLAVAQFILGDMYFFKLGVPADTAKAIQWWKKSAEQGFAAAQRRLGRYWYSPWEDNTHEDYIKSAQWYQKAATQGDARAQLQLGMMYALGKGVPMDTAYAVQLWKKASEQGQIGAQYFLGVMYMLGQGAPRDRWTGCNLLRASAEQGYEEAIAIYNNYCADDKADIPLAKIEKSINGEMEIWLESIEEFGGMK